MNNANFPAPYVASPCDLVLHDMRRSAVVFGPYGSGRNTAMLCLQRRWQEQMLFVPWDPAHPPYAGDENVQLAVQQSIRAAVARQVVGELEERPQVLEQMPPLCREFLRWLLANGLASRWLQVKQRLIPQLGLLFEGHEEKELYPDNSADSVRSQIDEMVLLANELGYQKLILFFQAPSPLPLPAIRRLGTLVGWRDLWQQRHFLLKAALHTTAMEQGQLVTTSQGRIEFYRMQWTLAEARQVADAWAAYFSQGAVDALASVAEPALLDAATGFLQDIRGELLPGDHRELAELVLDLAAIRRRRLRHDEDVAELRRYVYRKLAPLQIAANGAGVRRGARFIKVREQPLRVLELLSHLHGDTRQALLDLAGSQNNLHKQISELRKAIEPLPAGSREWVYVCNTAEGNYVVEGAVAREAAGSGPVAS